MPSCKLYNVEKPNYAYLRIPLSFQLSHSSAMEPHTRLQPALRRTVMDLAVKKSASSSTGSERGWYT